MSDNTCCVIKAGGNFVVGDGSSAANTYADCVNNPANYGCDSTGVATNNGGSGTLVSTLLGGGTPTQDFKSYSIAIAVLIVLTLSLPKQWGIWLPILALLAYGANHAGVVNSALNSLGIASVNTYGGGSGNNPTQSGTLTGVANTIYNDLQSLINSANFGTAGTTSNSLPPVSIYDNTNPIDTSGQA